jgi:hypothetical protein
MLELFFAFPSMQSQSKVTILLSENVGMLEVKN